MNTPQELKRAKFNHKANSIIANIETSFDNAALPRDSKKLQQDLDDLAESYQSDTHIGKQRHKLYDAQALLFYYLGNKDRSMEFVDAAEELNDGPTPISLRLRRDINNASYNKGRGRADEQAGEEKVGGWLGFLVFVLVIGVAYNAYDFFSELNIKNSLLTTKTFTSYPGLSGLITAEIIAAAIAVISGVSLIYLILLWFGPPFCLCYGLIITVGSTFDKLNLLTYFQIDFIICSSGF